MSQRTLFARPLVACLLGASLLATPAVARKIEIPFDTNDFSTPLTIDNMYWPLVPGSEYVYKAEGQEGCEVDVFEVTNGVKVINIDGDMIDTRIVHDTAYEDEECEGDLIKVEETYDWFAQDDDGNIWYFGEETYDCDEEGCELGDGSWEAGVDGARPGIVMLADPQPGDQYRQEYYEGFAQDWGQVMRTNDTAILHRDDAYSPGEWDDCLVIKEWNELEPGHVEQKYYCPDVGNVAVDEHHGAKFRFELTEEDEFADAFVFRVPPQ